VRHARGGRGVLRKMLRAFKTMVVFGWFVGGIRNFFNTIFSNPAETLLPMLQLVIEKGNITYYEYKHKHVPSEIVLAINCNDDDRQIPDDQVGFEFVLEWAEFLLNRSILAE
jgi:hypothetical protein